MPSAWKPLSLWPVLLWTLAISAAAQPAARIPEEFVARFELTTQGAKIGEAEWTVERLNADTFVYQSRTVAAGVLSIVSDEEIVERSKWRLEDEKLKPLEYTYRRSGGRRDRNVAVTFDWDNMLAENTASGHTWRMPVPEGTLDKLSYVLVLMKDLASDEPSLNYLIADGGRLKTYELRIEGEEHIDSALGSMETVIVRRLRNDEQRETLLWCAPRFGHLPVMIEHRDGDDILILRIQSVEGLGG